MCTLSNEPQRTYSFNLDSRSLVTATLFSWDPTHAMATIGSNGTVCSSNAANGGNGGNAGNGGVAASTTCQTILPVGPNSFHLCTLTGNFQRGSIVIQPLE